MKGKGGMKKDDISIADCDVYLSDGSSVSSFDNSLAYGLNDGVSSCDDNSSYGFSFSPIFSNHRNKKPNQSSPSDENSAVKDKDDSSFADLYNDQGSCWDDFSEWHSIGGLKNLLGVEDYSKRDAKKNSSKKRSDSWDSSPDSSLADCLPRYDSNEMLVEFPNTPTKCLQVEFGDSLELPVTNEGAPVGEAIQPKDTGGKQKRKANRLLLILISATAIVILVLIALVAVLLTRNKSEDPSQSIFPQFPMDPPVPAWNLTTAATDKTDAPDSKVATDAPFKNSFDAPTKRPTGGGSALFSTFAPTNALINSTSGAAQTTGQSTLPPTVPSTITSYKKITNGPTVAEVETVPTATPTNQLTTSPTDGPMVTEVTPAPTATPTNHPTSSPTDGPTVTEVTPVPTATPINQSTISPTDGPTVTEVTPVPTTVPTATPTNQPTTSPTDGPTVAEVTPVSTATPTNQPTKPFTNQPTNHPTEPPTKQPVVVPTKAPSAQPTVSPTSPPEPETCEEGIELMRESPNFASCINRCRRAPCNFSFSCRATCACIGLTGETTCLSPPAWLSG